eukprot:TRINITY_DN32221_c0_g1_i1.p1 TRINITY_DN32221_c0_g1~~TRINITY_DN32221_c0_g1_i1.p1  ORF type:complete len:344 (-),score=34.72 TRINITY_DN32221_c0_g1_i1:164-1195(-)
MDHHEENNGRGFTAPRLQKELSKFLDCTRLRTLESTLQRQCNWPQLEVLRDLRHSGTSHKWIWQVDARSGTVMSPCDYVISVQRRLGARTYEARGSCRLCGACLDPQLVHSECCDVASATRGHYAVVREVVRGLRLADPTVTTEVRGLTSTSSRPADILTYAAVPGHRTALDVCVVPPNASGAAGDAAEAAFRRKMRTYRREIAELAAAGISVRPMAWTSNGRPHPAATRTLHYAAELAANRNEDASAANALLSRWQHEIQVAIQRRAAAITRAVLPRTSAANIWLLTGYPGGTPNATNRARPLHQAPVSSRSSQEACVRDSGEDEEGIEQEQWTDEETASQA